MASTPIGHQEAVVAKFSDLQAEISVVAARGLAGTMVEYPAFEHRHRNHILDETTRVTQRQFGHPRRHLARLNRLETNTGRDRDHRQFGHRLGDLQHQVVELGRPQDGPGYARVHHGPLGAVL